MTSNKRFFNIDLDIVNDRLWNGYYLTPDQFVNDIQCIVHDSKTSSDRDRTNRAEEMLVNCQSHVSEVFDETLVLECQRMAEREFERHKIVEAEREAKAKKKADREKEKERLRLAAQQNQNGQSASRMIEFPAADVVAITNANGDTNSGLRMMTNGNGDGISEDPRNQLVPESSPFGSQQGGSQSQIYSTTRSTSPTPYPPMAARSDPDLIQQYNASPQLTKQPNTQPQPYTFPSKQPVFSQQELFPGPPNSDSGRYSRPDNVTPFSGDHSQSMGIYQFSPPNQFSRPANQLYPLPSIAGHYGGPQPISAAPITTPSNHGSASRPVLPRPNVSTQPPLKNDPGRVERLLQEVTRQTEGYTLEQLEQVYAACMDIIWRLRHEWDRTIVIMETENCIRRVMNEIELMKKERQQDRIGH